MSWHERSRFLEFTYYAAQTQRFRLETSTLEPVNPTQFLPGKKMSQATKKVQFYFC